MTSTKLSTSQDSLVSALPKKQTVRTPTSASRIIYTVPIATGAPKMIALAPRGDGGFQDEMVPPVAPEPAPVDRARRSLRLRRVDLRVAEESDRTEGHTSTSPRPPTARGSSRPSASNRTRLLHRRLHRHGQSENDNAAAPSGHRYRRGTKVTTATANLNALFRDLSSHPRRPTMQRIIMPLFANDIAFVPGTSIAYVSANGADEIFRVRFDATTGAVAEVSSAASKFIDARRGCICDEPGENPIGLVA